MILDLDLGNSFIKWRCASGNGLIANRNIDAQSLTRYWSGLAPQRVRMGSVAGDDVEAVLRRWVLAHWGLAIEQAKTQSECRGLINSYADPRRMGVDRWLAMLAARESVRGGCCVVDCGSAITVDYIAEDGRHLGGYIMPGLQLMRRGLLDNTQRIQIDFDSTDASTDPGCCTEEAVQHGLYLMVSALAERIVRDLDAKLGASARLVIAGGDGELFQRWAGKGEYCPDLVLDGLAVALP